MGCFWGCKWITTDTVEVPPVKGEFNLSGYGLHKTLLKMMMGYKRVHQECANCGERRVLQEA